MPESLKLAAIGVGGIWNMHARNLEAIGGAEVVAVCDLDEANRSKWAQSLGAEGYDSIDALLQDQPALDGIIACTPPTVRRQVIEAAAQRGLPVLVEKPPAFTLEDARGIVASLRQTPTPVMVGFMYRYLAAVDRVRELLAGRVINQVQSRFLCPAVTKWKLPGWMLIKERSGGHVLDQAVHVMDLIRYLTGDLNRVYTVGTNVIRPKRDDFTIEDSSSTVMHFDSGATGTHVHSWGHSAFSGVITWLGEDFRITLDLDEGVSGFVGDQPIDETHRAQPEGCSHHQPQMQAFLRIVREGQAAADDPDILRTPYDDAAKSLATVLAMNESIERGQPVDVAAIN